MKPTIIYIVLIIIFVSVAILLSVKCRRNCRQNSLQTGLRASISGDDEPRQRACANRCLNYYQRRCATPKMRNVPYCQQMNDIEQECKTICSHSEWMEPPVV